MSDPLKNEEMIQEEQEIIDDICEQDITEEYIEELTEESVEETKDAGDCFEEGQVLLEESSDSKMKEQKKSWKELLMKKDFLGKSAKKEHNKEEKQPEKEHKEKKKREFDISIKGQLLIGFMIPVIFVIIVGVVSYKKAESGMIANYETSAQNTIETQMEYIDFGLSLIRSDLVQMKLDLELQSLVGGTYKNDRSKASSVYNKSTSTLGVKATLNKFIQTAYIIPKSDNRIMSSTGGDAKGNGFYEKWAATEEGKQIVSNGGWVGYHPEMDGMTGYNSEEYMLSYMSAFTNKAAVIVADISKKAIIENLQGIDLTEGAMVGFVTADGKEILVKEDTNDKEIVFGEQEFFQNTKTSEENIGIDYIKYDGKDYLFIHCKSEETGATLVYMVPKAKVTASASAIRSITVILVILSCVVAAAIGIGISYNITSSMASIIRRMKKVAAGDLTVQMKVKGHSEFSDLNRHIAEMITGTRKLIQEVESIVDDVTVSADSVDHVSGDVENSSGGIVEALQEIDMGVTQQAEDAQQCLMQMDGLSQIIQEITEDIEETVANSETTKTVVSKGIDTMEVLSTQTRDTISITSKVKEDIKILENKSKEIRAFVDIIGDIASQTNLLSLNASIEAARAGEAGRGFAVVAEEIRKLADGSQQAANEINNVVGVIEKQTIDTVNAALKAEEIVEEQAGAVSDTKKVFEQILQSTDSIIADIVRVSDSIASMDTQRAGTLEAISSISAVSEETAAASNRVFDIAQGQKDVVASLTKASEDLKDKTEALRAAISVFTTN